MGKNHQGNIINGSGKQAHEKDVLRVAEAAELLGVKTGVIYRLAAERAIPCRKVGGQWRFSRVALLLWLTGDEATYSRAIYDGVMAKVSTSSMGRHNK